jgi:hypothetical protein
VTGGRINVHALRDRVDAASLPLYALPKADLLALLDAVEAAMLAVPVSGCDTEGCSPPSLCATGGSCARMRALDALARFDFDAGDAP